MRTRLLCGSTQQPHVLPLSLMIVYCARIYFYLFLPFICNLFLQFWFLSIIILGENENAEDCVDEELVKRKAKAKYHHLQKNQRTYDTTG